MNPNPLITRVHNEFKHIRYGLSIFFSNFDRELIRFQFGETPSQFQFRIKFSSTHRSLRFTVNKNELDRVIAEKMEKTTDIITDIDEINKTIGDPEVILDSSATFSQTLSELFLWGIQKNKDRGREIFRAPAERLPNWTDDNPAVMSNSVLYFDIIDAFEVVSEPDKDGYIEVRLDLHWSEPYFINCPQYYLENVRPGRLLIVNWLQRYNIMNFTSAKHHLNFTPADYQLITMYLLHASSEEGEENSCSQRKQYGCETELRQSIKKLGRKGSYVKVHGRPYLKGKSHAH